MTLRRLNAARRHLEQSPPADWFFSADFGYEAPKEGEEGLEQLPEPLPTHEP